MAQKVHSLSHANWLCSTTLSSPLSIDEKLSIINIEGHLMPDSESQRL